MSDLSPEPDARPPAADASEDATHRRLPVGVAVVALILLAVPIVVLAVVPIYARDEPELLGFPFFYWFQMIMVVGAALMTGIAYAIVQHARRGHGR